MKTSKLRKSTFAFIPVAVAVFVACDATSFRGSTSREPIQTKEGEKVGDKSPNELDAGRNGTAVGTPNADSPGRTPGGEEFPNGGVNTGGGGGGLGQGGGRISNLPGQGGGSGGGVAQGRPPADPSQTGQGQGQGQGGGGVIGAGGQSTGGGSGGAVVTGKTSPRTVNRNPSAEPFPSNRPIPGTIGGGTGGGSGGGSGGGLAGTDSRVPGTEPFPGGKGGSSGGGGNGTGDGDGKFPGGSTPPPGSTATPLATTTPGTGTPGEGDGDNGGGGGDTYPGQNPPVVRKPNPEPFPPVVTPEPKPTPPPGKVLLELKVVQLNYESWWQNCLDVTVGSEQKRIACNKWTSGFGTTRYFFADMPPACNAVKVSVSTFKNQGTNCTTRLKQGLPCNGPYASTPDWTRSPSRSADRPFFFGYDFKTILSRDPLIKFPFDYAGLKSEMESYRDGGANRWLRIFFEDQPKANLDAVRADPSIWHEKGIDFNDYIFDVKGENVLFYVEGSGPQGCGGQ